MDIIGTCNFVTFGLFMIPFLQFIGWCIVIGLGIQIIGALIEGVLEFFINIGGPNETS